MANRNNISKECFNRVSIWNEALHRALCYLHVEKNLEKMDINHEHYFRFIVVGKPHGIRTYSIIRDSLIESAIVNFMQIFSSGSEGYGISNNRRNSDIIESRKQLIKNTIDKLNWTRTEYNEIFNLLKRQKNCLLTHYDGNFGNYRELCEGLSSRKVIGIHLKKKDKDKFGMMVKTMYECLFNYLYTDDSI